MNRKWIYRQSIGSSNSFHLKYTVENWLDQWGKEGWELCNVEHVYDPVNWMEIVRYIAYFKKEVDT